MLTFIGTLRTIVSAIVPTKNAAAAPKKSRDFFPDAEYDAASVSMCF
jgi:hypothetical protein